MSKSPKLISEESIYKAITLLKVSMGYLLFAIEISVLHLNIHLKTSKGILKANSSRKIGCISLLSPKCWRSIWPKHFTDSSLFRPSILLNIPAAFNKLSNKAFSRLNYKMSDLLLHVLFSNFQFLKICALKEDNVFFRLVRIFKSLSYTTMGFQHFPVAIEMGLCEGLNL